MLLSYLNKERNINSVNFFHMKNEISKLAMSNVIYAMTIIQELVPDAMMDEIKNDYEESSQDELLNRRRVVKKTSIIKFHVHINYFDDANLKRCVRNATLAAHSAISLNLDLSDNYQMTMTRLLNSNGEIMLNYINGNWKDKETEMVSRFNKINDDLEDAFDESFDTYDEFQNDLIYKFNLNLDNILIILLNAMLRKYGGAMGDQYISDAAVVQSVMVIAICPAEGLTNGCSALFGYYYGAKNYKRILQSFYCVLVACAVYLGLLTVATQICPQSFAKLFLSDQAAIRLTSDFIRKDALGIIFIAIQFAFVDGFTAMGMVKEAIPISLVRKSLYIIATLILPVVSPLEDIFYASSFADIAGAIFTLIIFFAVLKPRLKRSIY